MGWYLGWLLSTMFGSWWLLVLADSPARAVRFWARLGVLVTLVAGGLSGCVALMFIVFGLFR